MTAIINAKCLDDVGLKLGDLVSFLSDKESTGGIVFQIVENVDRAKPASTSRIITVCREVWSHATQRYENTSVKETEHGEWDEQGRRISPGHARGYVRIKPLFEFFATRKGKKPKGKGDTIMIYYDQLYLLRKVDIVTLGVKYVELGNIIRDMTRIMTNDE